MFAMKTAATLLVILAWASHPIPASAALSSSTPMARVVSLLTEMRARIEADGKSEQKSYDKFACWCEKTLARKAADISAAKERIEELQTLIYKLKGDLGSHGAEIKQLEKDIAANLESQREATEVRDKENGEYQEERTESEQCIGALEAAITVLTGAGAKKGFLETLQEAQLLSVVAGVRGLLHKEQVSQSTSDKDLQMVKRFVDAPDSFIGSRTEGLSAAQIANNPFGDYAPQSTQIQGILKGMYDAFTSGLEKSNAEEAEKQKAYEELMETKKQELATLQATLEKQTGDEAEKTQKLADSRAELDDTKAQLEADEKFFAETKASCKSKAGEWAERTRLRTQELQGINKAVEILNSPEARRTFQSATTTFLQISDVPRADAYGQLRNLATQYGSLSLAKIAAQVKTGGHFDKVIVMIDKMIELLRKEEQEDIAHRDRCQSGSNTNKYNREDLASAIDKAEKELLRMTDVEKEMKTQIATLEDDIKATKDEMAERLEMRNEERTEFKAALKDDADAVGLLGEAIVALSEFYKTNKIPLELAQQEPEYTVDQDKAPETIWSGGDYGGRKKESTGIIAILSMLKEDMEMEMKTGREEDAAAQKKYEEDRKAMQGTLDSQLASKTQTEKDLAEHQAKMADTQQYVDQHSADLEAAKDMQATLEHDCAWVETHFDTRRDKRKNEIDGLVDAKNILAGADSGNDDDTI